MAQQISDKVGLIFGGGGFIGRSLCEALVGMGVRPVVADMVVNPDSDYETLQCDITDSRRVRDVMDEVKPSIVFHLAAKLATDTFSDPVLATTINVNGMLNVVDAAAQSGVARFVYASSIAVYGDQPHWGDHSVTEEDHAQPAFLYGFHKQLNEATAALYQEKFGMTCAGLRISTVYGAGRKTGMSAPINGLIEGAYNGDTQCPFGPDTDSCLVHVDDVSMALALLGTSPTLAHPIYNVGGDFGTIGQLADWMEELQPGVRINLATSGSRIPHVSLVDNSRIRLEFNFTPRNFEKWARQALRESVAVPRRDRS